MADCGHFFLLLACVGLLMVQLTTSAPNPSNADSRGTGTYEEDLIALLQILENQQKTQDDPTTTKPATQDPHRNHQVIFSADGPHMNPPKGNELHPITEDVPQTEGSDKRKIKEKTQLWDGGRVPYSFSPSKPISQTNQEKIRKMMDKIEESTCITWEPNSTNYHVQIEDGTGCHSQTGNFQSSMSSIGFQTISLKQDSCMDDGTILHELCHTLGLEHELSRPDRDKYVTINWDSVVGGQHNPNMEKKDDLLLFDVPYDQTSVMHYSPYAMAKQQGSKTYVAKDPILGGLILEDHHDLSYYDKLLINRAYDCAGHCGPKNCTHGEFLSEECTCICPPGLIGELCESVKQEGVCTNEDHLVIGAIDETVTVESSDYPGSYSTGATCRWLVEGPKGSKLRVTILDMSIASLVDSSGENYCLHSMELRYNLIGQPGPEFCGDTKGQIMTLETADYSEANTMLVSFDTTNKMSSEGYRGFKLDFTAIQGNDATKPVDFCKGITCQNGGTCHFNDNNYWCGCVSGFSGRNCEHTSGQNGQTDQDTVFYCDKMDTRAECKQINLGTAWEINDDGRFVVKPGQQGPVNLPIPYVITHLDQQYCFHFKISRPSSPQQTTCSEVRFIITKEMDLSGFLFIYDEHLLFDDDCSAKIDVSEAISFTSQHKITKMKFEVDNIPVADANVALSDFRLQLATCP